MRLVDDRHVAIFRLGEQQFFAIDNVDPKSQASVLSRGLIGSLGEHIVVASPLYKNHFDLRTGECLESPSCRCVPTRCASRAIGFSSPWLEPHRLANPSPTGLGSADKLRTMHIPATCLFAICRPFSCNKLFPGSSCAPNSWISTPFVTWLTVSSWWVPSGN